MFVRLFPSLYIKTTRPQSGAFPNVSIFADEKDQRFRSYVLVVLVLPVEEMDVKKNAF